MHRTLAGRLHLGVEDQSPAANPEVQSAQNAWDAWDDGRQAHRRDQRDYSHQEHPDAGHNQDLHQGRHRALKDGDRGRK